MPFFAFIVYCSDDHRDLHSFPTRRSSDLQRAGERVDARVVDAVGGTKEKHPRPRGALERQLRTRKLAVGAGRGQLGEHRMGDRKSTRLNSSHMSISYAVFCLKKKKKKYSG